ncbi:sugar-binding protein [Klebsiella pneumoniae]|nr:sugar-binding protein [Klebsiella pneumoniae]
MNSWRRGKTFESKLGKQYYPVVLEHQDVLALLNSYMVQKYNQPAIDEKGRKFSYSKAQWADFFGMYKKLIDSHVMPDTRYYASFRQEQHVRNEAVDPGRMGRDLHVELHHQQIFR